MTSSLGSLVTINNAERPLARVFQRLVNNLIRLQNSEEIGGLIAFIEARFSLVEQIREHQFYNEKLLLIRDKLLTKEVVIDTDDVLRIRGKIYVFKTGKLIRLIIEEDHCSLCYIHLGAAKMYHDLNQHYWCCRMKNDIPNCVSRCLTCQKVKCEHHRPEDFS
ncbi:hypothetical protein MTR67_044065 [Solanum verrucosum]|uniref:Integrase zinc-binding domain-containing protein n=1 Tax=Solanum verrucosum TaxID=315347 RepID=A0AAF0UQ64_SOLVR|nr:hypothetical protein MTR67_044065 [Solanum verrucosum]